MKTVNVLSCVSSNYPRGIVHVSFVIFVPTINIHFLFPWSRHILYFISLLSCRWGWTILQLSKPKCFLTCISTSEWSGKSCSISHGTHMAWPVLCTMHAVNGHTAWFRLFYIISSYRFICIRAHSRLAPSEWETPLLVMGQSYGCTGTSESERKWVKFASTYQARNKNASCMYIVLESLLFSFGFSSVSRFSI